MSWAGTPINQATDTTTESAINDLLDIITTELESYTTTYTNYIDFSVYTVNDSFERSEQLRAPYFHVTASGIDYEFNAGGYIRTVTMDVRIVVTFRETADDGDERENMEALFYYTEDLSEKLLTIYMGGKYFQPIPLSVNEFISQSDVDTRIFSSLIQLTFGQLNAFA